MRASRVKLSSEAFGHGNIRIERVSQFSLDDSSKVARPLHESIYLPTVPIDLSNLSIYR